jgi:hypothetical protein
VGVTDFHGLRAPQWMQVLQYVITYQEVMTHTRAYRARPRSEKLSAAEAVETKPGKTMPAGEHKSLGAVLNLKRHNLWVHQPKIRNRLEFCPVPKLYPI